MHAAIRRDAVFEISNFHSFMTLAIRSSFYQPFLRGEPRQLLQRTSRHVLFKSRVRVPLPPLKGVLSSDVVLLAALQLQLSFLRRLP